MGTWGERAHVPSSMDRNVAFSAGFFRKCFTVLRRSISPACPLLTVKMGGLHRGTHVNGIDISTFITTCPARCVAWYVQPTVGSPHVDVADSARASGDGDMGGRPATPTAPAVCIFALSTRCRTADKKSRSKRRHVTRYRFGCLTLKPVRLAKQPLQRIVVDSNAQTASAEDCLGHALACCLWTTGRGRRREENPCKQVVHIRLVLRIKLLSRNRRFHHSLILRPAHLGDMKPFSCASRAW